MLSGDVFIEFFVREIGPATGFDVEDVIRRVDQKEYNSHLIDGMTCLQYEIRRNLEEDWACIVNLLVPRICRIMMRDRRGLLRP